MSHSTNPSRLARLKLRGLTLPLLPPPPSLPLLSSQTRLLNLQHMFSPSVKGNEVCAGSPLIRGYMRETEEGSVAERVGGMGGWWWGGSHNLPCENLSTCWPQPNSASQRRTPTRPPAGQLKASTPVAEVRGGWVYLCVWGGVIEPAL